MAYPIDFDKSNAARWLEAIATGKPLTPPQGGWTAHHLMALAGALHFAAMAHGPLNYILKPDAYEKLPPEHREATEEIFSRDLDAAIRFYSQLTMLVKDGWYDDAFDPVARAVVYQDDEGLHVLPHSGFKQYPSGNDDDA
jgi:hypothetical protein